MREDHLVRDGNCSKRAIRESNASKCDDRDESRGSMGMSGVVVDGDGNGDSVSVAMAPREVVARMDVAARDVPE